MLIFFDQGDCLRIIEDHQFANDFANRGVQASFEFFLYFGIVFWIVAFDLKKSVDQFYRPIKSARIPVGNGIFYNDVQPVHRIDTVLVGCKQSFAEFVIQCAGVGRGKSASHIPHGIIAHITTGSLQHFHILVGNRGILEMRSVFNESFQNDPDMSGFCHIFILFIVGKKRFVDRFSVVFRLRIPDGIAVFMHIQFDVSGFLHRRLLLLLLLRGKTRQRKGGKKSRRKNDIFSVHHDQFPFLRAALKRRIWLIHSRRKESRPVLTSSV